MSREIKFRVWKPEVKSLMELEDQFVSEALHYSKDGNHKIMQYTGLKDKNGKEIYEGDILRVSSENTLLNWEVIYVGDYATFSLFRGKDYQFCMGIEHINHGMSGTEVIGNIYENKELLEDK